MIRRFPFALRPYPNDCTALFLAGGLTNLSVFGMVHDAIEHGVLGLPFGYDGELMAVGAGFWRNTSAGPSFGINVARQLHDSSPYHEPALVGEGMSSCLPNDVALAALPRDDRRRIALAAEYLERELQERRRRCPLLHEVEQRIAAGFLSAARVFGAGVVDKGYRERFEKRVNGAGEILSTLQRHAQGIARAHVCRDHREPLQEPATTVLVEIHLSYGEGREPDLRVVLDPATADWWRRTMEVGPDDHALLEALAQPVVAVQPALV